MQIAAPTLAGAAAGLRAHGQTGYLLRVLPSGERTAIRQAGTRRGSCAQTRMCGDSSFAWNRCDSRTLVNAAPQHAEGANQRVSAPRGGSAGRASSSVGLLFQPCGCALSHASESGWPFSYMRATMTTIRQFMQTSPAKAMELFTKLLDTSDNAIKTRERLFEAHLSDSSDNVRIVGALHPSHRIGHLRR